MTADAMYKLVQYVADKSQAGYISPAQFNLIAPQSSDSYLAFLLGQLKGRNSKVEIWTNRKHRQSLSPFIAPPTTLSIDGSGFSSYPTDYVLIDAMYTTQMNRVRFVQQNKLYSVLNSVIDPVSTNPIYMIENNGFRFYPTSLTTAKISFIRKPAKIKWGYTLDGNGRPVFDSGSSVDPEWDDVDMLEIICRALRMIGVNLQSNVISQYAEEIKNYGQ